MNHIEVTGLYKSNPYITIKLVNAKPMTAEEAVEHNYRIGENTGKAGYEVTYASGYKSWCPADEFEPNALMLPNAPLESAVRVNNGSNVSIRKVEHTISFSAALPNECVDTVQTLELIHGFIAMNSYMLWAPFSDNTTTLPSIVIVSANDIKRFRTIYEYVSNTPTDVITEKDWSIFFINIDDLLTTLKESGVEKYSDGITCIRPGITPYELSIGVLCHVQSRPY